MFSSRDTHEGTYEHADSSSYILLVGTPICQNAGKQVQSERQGTNTLSKAKTPRQGTNTLSKAKTPRQGTNTLSKAKKSREAKSKHLVCLRVHLSV